LLNRGELIAMATWRVVYLGKHLGTVEAPDQESAVAQAAKQFHITPARRNKVMVTRLASKGD
jgi:hypothetical protein